MSIGLRHLRYVGNISAVNSSSANRHFKLFPNGVPFQSIILPSKYKPLFKENTLPLATMKKCPMSNAYKDNESLHSASKFVFIKPMMEVLYVQENTRSFNVSCKGMVFGQMNKWQCVESETMPENAHTDSIRGILHFKNIHLLNSGNYVCTVGNQAVFGVEVIVFKSRLFLMNTVQYFGAATLIVVCLVVVVLSLSRKQPFS
ncbi:hypothetical protein GJ496_008072 [Pomphorhynchus laevis]|nr:hypothetical protein GJ496_008072 [Pomphorhynchus laevis]